MITPLARRLVRTAYKITPEGAQRSLERVRGVFRQVDERLSDGRRFLAGERFTAADLTFAALAAPVLFPAECRAVHPALEPCPPRCARRSCACETPTPGGSRCECSRRSVAVHPPRLSRKVRESGQTNAPLPPAIQRAEEECGHEKAAQQSAARERVKKRCA